MELRPLQRRLVQLLLRRGMMLESELWRLIRLLPDGAQLTPSEFDEMLEDLERAGWLTVNTDGDEPRYRVQFSQKTSTSHEDLWDRLSLDSMRQQWNVNLPTVSETTPVQEDFLMRRGGKRALPKAIWDKLEDEPAGQPAPSGTETKSQSAALLDALDRPKPRPSSDKQDIRKKLRGALGDDGE
jgi:hypothetical protein